MADKKISQLDSELSALDLNANDLFAIVDVSASETKKIKAGSLSALIASAIALSQLSDVDDTATPLDTHVLMGNGTLWQTVAADVLPTLFFPTMAGQEGKYLKVNGTEDGFLWDTPAGGGGTSLPSYAGNAGLVLAVNATEDGIEWVVGGAGVQLDDINVWTAGNSGTVATISYGSNITLNFSDSNFFKITLTGNVVLENPTNIPNGGKSGSIWIRQDATGSRTWALGSYWKTKGSAPVLSTTANAIDRLDYVVESSTRVEYALTKGITA